MDWQLQLVIRINSIKQPQASFEVFQGSPGIKV